MKILFVIIASILQIPVCMAVFCFCYLVSEQNLPLSILSTITLLFVYDAAGALLKKLVDDFYDQL